MGVKKGPPPLAAAFASPVNASAEYYALRGFCYTPGALGLWPANVMFSTGTETEAGAFR